MREPVSGRYRIRLRSGQSWSEVYICDENKGVRQQPTVVACGRLKRAQERDQRQNPGLGESVCRFERVPQRASPEQVESLVATGQVRLRGE